MIIRISWPDPVLFPNRKGGRHWGAYQRAKESARTEGWAAARSVAGRSQVNLGNRAAVQIMFHAPDRRRRDLDGMLGAIKHHVDGIAKALGVDDSIFRPVSMDWTVDEKRQGFVTVEIQTI